MVQKLRRNAGAFVIDPDKIALIQTNVRNPIFRNTIINLAGFDIADWLL